jgi:cytosine deaminase
MAVTENPATILGLDGYGIAPGCYADLVVLQARDPVDAIRRRARRLQVLRRGRVIAKTAPLATEIDLPGRATRVDYDLS